MLAKISSSAVHSSPPPHQSDINYFFLSRNGQR